MWCVIKRKQVALVLAISSLPLISLIKLWAQRTLICADPISSYLFSKCFHLWLQDGPEMQIAVSWSSTSGKYCCVLYSQLHAVRTGCLLLAMEHYRTCMGLCGPLVHCFTYKGIPHSAFWSVLCNVRSLPNPVYCIHAGGKMPISCGKREMGI